MKKLTLLFGFILLFSSCNTKEECYSCNADIDAWVKENKTELMSMDREELSKLDLSRQRAALRMFSPERKKLLWTEKLTEVLQTPFSNDEKKYLKYAENVLKTHSFKKPFTEKESKEILDWMEQGKLKFGWTNEFLFNSFFIVGNSHDNQRINPEEPLDDCSCRYSISCFPIGRGCDYNDCSDTNDGCGFFGNSECKGICQ